MQSAQQDGVSGPTLLGWPTVSEAITQDLYLFEHNPPPIERSQRVHDLFCNRAWELRKGIEGLRTLASDGGDGMIHAVHGDSRVGKSHYVRKLLLDARNQQIRCRDFLISANNLGTARAVLTELFNAVWRVIDDASPGQAPQGQSGILEEYQAQLREYASLVNDPSRTFSRKRSRAEQASVQGGLKLLLPPLDLSGLGGNITTVGEEQSENQGPLYDQELLDILDYALDILDWLEAPKRALLVIDDIDLLDRDGQEGQPATDQVLDLLKKIASRTKVIVLVTIRERTFHERDKDFRPLLKMPRLDKEQTVEIYRRHVALFHAGQEVFDQVVLDRLCEHTRGQIGLFLRRCRELREHGDRHEALLPLTEDQLYRWIASEIEDMEQDNKTAPYLYPIMEAVRLGKLNLELPREVEQSRLCNNWVRSVGQGRYEIATLLFLALQRRLERPR